MNGGIKDFTRKIFALERDGAKKIRKDIIKWEDMLPTFFYFFNVINPVCFLMKKRYRVR